MLQDHSSEWLSDTLALYIEKSGKSPLLLEIFPDFCMQLSDVIGHVKQKNFSFYPVFSGEQKFLKEQI